MGSAGILLVLGSCTAGVAIVTGTAGVISMSGFGHRSNSRRLVVRVGASPPQVAKISMLTVAGGLSAPNMSNWTNLKESKPVKSGWNVL